MRIAYIDVNIRYLNRTREELINALATCGTLTLIGPGFSQGNSVEHLQSVLSSPESIDLIVTTPHIALASAFKRSDAHDISSLYLRSFSYNFSSAEFNQLEPLNAIIAQAAVPRILLLLEADYYNFDNNRIAAFKNISDMILGFGPECWRHTASMPHLADESFANKATECWADFLDYHADKVSSLHHLIGDDEYCSVPLAKRSVQWSILGAPYHARKIATTNLQAAGIVPLSSNLMRKTIASLKKTGIIHGEKSWSIDITQWNFRRLLRKSRYSYTCGSGLDMPVRKFFEIPASGNVLICRSFYGAEKLGFQSGKNYLECEPEDIIDAHLYLEQNPEKAQKIANAGRHLILSKHSIAARANQIKIIFNALLTCQGVGRWKNGQYIIESADSQKGTSRNPHYC